MKELIPTLGPRALFLKKLSELTDLQSASFSIYEESEATSDSNETLSVSDVSAESLPLPQDFVEDTILEDIPVGYVRQTAKIGQDLIDACNQPSVDLTSLLQASVEGQQILKSKGNLTPALRNKIVEIIINNEFKDNPGQKIYRDRFIELARHIKKIFPLRILTRITFHM